MTFDRLQLFNLNAEMVIKRDCT